MEPATKGFGVELAGVTLTLLGSGALWWPALRLLVVSDLHLGKAARPARDGGAMLPPYDSAETLTRLEADIGRMAPATVVCLGDSFDDKQAAAALDAATRLRLTRLQAGRRWIWIAGNHDPGPADSGAVSLGGSHMAELRLPPLCLRHIARADASAEISGHYHPKAAIRARGASISRPCFLVDAHRIVLPAYGAYCGGLRATDPALAGLMRRDALAVLTGAQPTPVPMPRRG